MQFKNRLRNRCIAAGTYQAGYFLGGRENRGGANVFWFTLMITLSVTTIIMLCNCFERAATQFSVLSTHINVAITVDDLFCIFGDHPHESPKFVMCSANTHSLRLHQPHFRCSSGVDLLFWRPSSSQHAFTAHLLKQQLQTKQAQTCSNKLTTNSKFKYRP